jgi:manganese/zinc/iron transport system substrate-binding protein
MSRLIAFGWLAFCTVFAGCSPGAAHSESHESSGGGHRYAGEYPIRVVCTTGPVAEMIARVGGEYVSVDALMGPGVDPHLYKPVASDLRKLSAADAIFYNGLHLEGRMGETFVQMARKKATFAVTERIQSRRDERLREPPEFEGLYDPHVWHDPVLWADCAKDTADMFAEFDPKHAGEYQRNAEAYRQELTELDEFCHAEIAKIPKERRVLITAHDAFGYFGKRYDLEVHGLKGISTDEEKDLDRQEELQQMIIERKIPAVFVESAVAPKTIEALVEPCRAAGWDLKIGGNLYADALGPAGTDDATFAGMIRHNVRTIAAALSAK